MIQQLARIGRQVLIKEDTYDLPPHLAKLPELLTQQPLLQAFVELPAETQYQVLVLIDYFANAIAQGIPEMNMPFGFRSPTGWHDLFTSNGLVVRQTILTGFETGRMHKSCHIWFDCKRASH